MDTGGAAFAEKFDLDTLNIGREDAAQRGLALIGEDFDHGFVKQDAQVE